MTRLLELPNASSVVRRSRFEIAHLEAHVGEQHKFADACGSPERRQEYINCLDARKRQVDEWSRVWWFVGEEFQSVYGSRLKRRSRSRRSRRCERWSSR